MYEKTSKQKIKLYFFVDALKSVGQPKKLHENRAVFVTKKKAHNKVAEK